MDTKSRLKKLIREEIGKQLSEARDGRSFNAPEVKKIIAMMNAIDIDEEIMAHIIDQVGLSHAFRQAPVF